MTSPDRPTFAEGDFRKASASNPDKECVRVARRGGWVELRDDKAAFGAPDDHRIVLTGPRFDVFQAGVRAGAAGGLPLRLDRRTDGTYGLAEAGSPGATLTFTEPEVRAFLAGVRAGEFDRTAYDGPSAAA